MRLAYLAEGVEDVVEINQNLAFCDLGYVVHGLAGIVSDPSILVGEACENWWYDDLEVPRKLLFVMRITEGRV